MHLVKTSRLWDTGVFVSYISDRKLAIATLTSRLVYQPWGRPCQNTRRTVLVPQLGLWTHGRLRGVWCSISNTGKARGDWNRRAATLGTCPKAWHALRQFRGAPHTRGEDNRCQETNCSGDEKMPTHSVKFTLYVISSGGDGAQLGWCETSPYITSSTGQARCQVSPITDKNPFFL